MNCSSVDEILQRIKDWLKKNERITYQSIFTSMDLSRSGELAKELFASCFRRIGIDIQEKELLMLGDCLDKRGIGFYSYVPLINEIAFNLG